MLKFKLDLALRWLNIGTEHGCCCLLPTYLWLPYRLAINLTSRWKRYGAYLQ